MPPLVSVIMPAYNAQEYIEAAIRSVQAQTVEDWELLVIDDCSVDQTRRVVETMARSDSRIRIILNEENMGTARSRNRGIELRRGRYVAFLDSDDQWRPRKLELQLALAKEKNADIVYSSYAIVDQYGEKLCNDFVVPPTTSLKAMLCRNDIGCSTVLLSERAAAQYRFLESFYHEDYALWLKILQDGMIAVAVPEVLVDYRYHTDSRASNKLSSAKRRWRIYRDLVGMSLVQSSWYQLRYAFNGVWKYRRK